MSNDNRAHQAFPYCGVGDDLNYSKGMTLRDYFAAKAMAALISCAPNHGDLPHTNAAVDAYRYADAMIEKR